MSADQITRNKIIQILKGKKKNYIFESVITYHSIKIETQCYV